ncbi:hypothetical protein ACSDQ9_07405 [Aestuariimicrobium soli]
MTQSTPEVVLIVFALVVGAGVIISIGWMLLAHGRTDDDEPTDSFIED